MYVISFLYNSPDYIMACFNVQVHLKKFEYQGKVDFFPVNVFKKGNFPIFKIHYTYSEIFQACFCFNFDD